MRPIIRPLAMYFAAFVAILALTALPACPGPGPGPVIATATVDCLAENPNDINLVYEELKPLLSFSKPDWSAIYQRAKQAGIKVGGCVIGKLIQFYLGGRRAPELDDSWAARGLLEEYRKNELGGATIHVMVDGKILDL